MFIASDEHVLCWGRTLPALKTNAFHDGDEHFNAVDERVERRVQASTTHTHTHTHTHTRTHTHTAIATRDFQAGFMSRWLLPNRRLCWDDCSETKVSIDAQQLLLLQRIGIQGKVYKKLFVLTSAYSQLYTFGSGLTIRGTHKIRKHAEAPELNERACEAF